MHFTDSTISPLSVGEGLSLIVEMIATLFDHCVISTTILSSKGIGVKDASGLSGRFHTNLCFRVIWHSVFGDLHDEMGKYKGV